METLGLFGVAMMSMCIFTAMFGEEAQGFSTLFALGSKGIPLASAVQFLVFDSLITVVRFMFFTDTFIRNMPIWARTVCMLSTILGLVVLFNMWFGWFPPDNAEAWTAFSITFGTCFAGGCLLTALQEKRENARMDHALRRLQKGEEDDTH